MFLFLFETKWNFCVFSSSTLRYVSSNLSGLGFNAWVNCNANKLAIIINRIVEKQ